MGQAQPKPMTIFEFIDWEPLQEGKHEFMDGYIVAMAGARPPHNRIISSLATRLGSHLNGSRSRCEGMTSDQAVYLHEISAYVYPDYLVACDPKFLKSGNQALENPVIVFEVLSPSTRDYDQGAKLTAYMKCPSLRQIVFIDSARVSVTSFFRVGEGWQKSSQLHKLTDILHLPAIDHSLPLSDLYETIIAHDPDFTQGPFLALEPEAAYR